MAHAQATSTLCFACSRCDYPLCEAADVLVERGARDATAQHVFCYHLDDLLDMECAVPCYSAVDEVQVLLGVSQQLLHLPLVPAARLLALHAVMDADEACRMQRGAQQAQSLHHDDNDGDTAGNADVPATRQDADVEVHDADGDDDAVASTTDGVRQLGSRALRTAAASAAAASRYSMTTQQRTDLVCVRASVLDDGGVRVCARGDDTDANGHVATTDNRHDEDDNNSNSATLHLSLTTSTTATDTPCGTCTRVTAAHTQRDGAERDISDEHVPSTQEQQAPGNMAACEEHVTATMTHTLTSPDGCFRGVACTHRVECPDCRLGLGYTFARDKSSSNSSSSSHVASANTSDDDDDAHTFVGLELKKLRQRAWTLRDFHARYAQAGELSSFRSLVAGAEERDVLHMRLAALRRQVQLYRDMLTVSKSKSDVHDALTQSQMARIAIYETKLQALKQIVRTLRDHNNILNQCLQQHTQLAETTRVKIHTLDTKIEMQATLIQQQNELIHVQREQMRMLEQRLDLQQQQHAATAAAAALQQLEQEYNANNLSSNPRHDNDTKTP